MLISPPNHEWRAQVSGLAAATDGTGATIASLKPISGQTSICGSDCAGVVSVGATSALPASLIQVTPTSGVQIPTSAVLTGPSGVQCVVLADNSVHKVSVTASAQGRSIVTGVSNGDRVVVNPSGSGSC